MIKGDEYDMESYVDECVATYCSFIKTIVAPLRHVDTPFINESEDPCGVTDLHGDLDAPVEGKIKNVKAYKEKILNDRALEQPGELSGIAAKCIMKIMYCSRYARADTLRAVSALSQVITKWTRLSDKKLHRVISYLHSSRKKRQPGFIGDPPR